MCLALPIIALLPDFGGGEMLLLMFVVLMLFGGDKMPQLAKGIGKAMREFRKAATEVEREIKRAIDEVPDTPAVPSADKILKDFTTPPPARPPVPPDPPDPGATPKT